MTTCAGVHMGFPNIGRVEAIPAFSCNSCRIKEETIKHLAEHIKWLEEQLEAIKKETKEG